MSKEKSIVENKNAYFQARKKVAKTRAEACDLLETISEDSLERIENERRDPNPAEVVEMAKCFKEPNLRNYYCANQCPVGDGFIQAVQFCELPQTVLQMVAALNAMQEDKDRLIEIAADGQIDDAEVEDFVKIQKDLEKIAITVDALKLWTEKMVNDGKINMEKYEALKK